MKKINVTKRNGVSQTLDIDKIHRVVEWGCEGISNVSISDIEMRSGIQFFEDITTDDIHEIMIKASVDLISENQPNYQYVAARLRLFRLRKQVLDQFDPIPLINLVETNIQMGFYDPYIMDSYTREEWNKIDTFIQHKRDFTFTFAGIEQFRTKYLIQDRARNIYYETPQYAYIMIALTLFKDYPKDTRMSYIKRYYDMISKYYISLPTPILAGCRSPQRQFSSCVVIESGDSLESISATSTAIVKYIANKAGIGINAGKIRAVGSPIREGDAFHTGVTPFFKLFESSVKSVNQGGVRSACVSKDSYVERCIGFEHDNKIYYNNDVLTIENKSVKVIDFINTVSYMPKEELENASMSDLFKKYTTIATTFNDDAQYEVV